MVNLPSCWLTRGIFPRLHSFPWLFLSLFGWMYVISVKLNVCNVRLPMNLGIFIWLLTCFLAILVPIVTYLYVFLHFILLSAIFTHQFIHWFLFFEFSFLSSWEYYQLWQTQLSQSSPSFQPIQSSYFLIVHLSFFLSICPNNLNSFLLVTQLLFLFCLFLHINPISFFNHLYSINIPTQWLFFQGYPFLSMHMIPIFHSPTFFFCMTFSFTTSFVANVVLCNLFFLLCSRKFYFSYYLSLYTLSTG